MTCYQRHLGWLFDSLGLPYEKGSRGEVHRALLGMLGLADDAHCPEVWAALKATYGIDTRTPSADLATDLAARLATTSE
jgi:hypothetical protein